MRSSSHGVRLRPAIDENASPNVRLISCTATVATHPQAIINFTPPCHWLSKYGVFNVPDAVRLSENGKECTRHTGPYCHLLAADRATNFTLSDAKLALYAWSTRAGALHTFSSASVAIDLVPVSQAHQRAARTRRGSCGSILDTILCNNEGKSVSSVSS